MGRGIRKLVLIAVAGAVMWATPAAALIWKPVTGLTSNIQEVATARTSDGTLHVAWLRATPGHGSANDIVHVAISSGGLVGSPTVIAHAFATASNPAIVVIPGGGLEVLFGGIQCGDPSCPSGMFSSTSSDGGASWSTPAKVLETDQAYASDMNAAVLSDGTPFETWWHTLGVTVHRGLASGGSDYDYQAAMAPAAAGTTATRPSTAPVTSSWPGTPMPPAIWASGARPSTRRPAPRQDRPR
jgi:hypothetical protein